MEDHLKKEYGNDNVVAHNLPELHQSNVKLAGGHHHRKFIVDGEEVLIVFNQRGCPIFDAHTVCEVRIPESIAKKAGDGKAHMRAATRALRTEIKAGRISADKFTPEQLSHIMKGKPKIPGLTWHHHEDFARCNFFRNQYIT